MLLISEFSEICTSIVVWRTEIRLVLPGELELETSSCFENRFRLVRLDIGSGLDRSTH